MNKKANRKAFFVCIFICLMYISVIMNLFEKVSFKRVANNQKVIPADTDISMQKNTVQAMSGIVPVPTVQVVEQENTVKPEQTKQPVQTDTPAAGKKAYCPESGDDCIEPSLFISLPLICFALKEGFIEKDGLIPAGKDSGETKKWKKPVEIIYDRDEEGLKHIAKTIGMKSISTFLKQKGILLKEGLSADEVMLGRGYTMERKKLLSLYKSVVSDEHGHMFPFVVNRTAIVIRNGNFEFSTIREKMKRQHAAGDQEWLMPNLKNLPIRVALDKLAIHTANIKIHGNGMVVGQSPKALDRVNGEAECIIYGKMQKQQISE